MSHRSLAHPAGPALVIDDNAQTLATMTRELSRWRRVIPCRTADEALRAVEPWGHVPSLVVADVSLGGWPDGVEVVRRLRERAGPVPALLMSGHAMLPADTIERLAALRPSVRFATKAAMRDAITELMELTSLVDPAINADLAELARAVRELTARVALSVTEQRLLALAIHGAKRAELAARLGTNVHTLKSQIRRLLRKTGFRDLHSLRRALLRDPPARMTPLPSG